ncbi:sirohydrochlorin chelatase [Cytobacillus luteolus]|uniref:sirohydrochlorin chelatase n=1 Tax=Litchfieldia luteola TaxID=682179 RepID=UPI001AE9A91A|nr:sirohydrochlorin chelatase [Cytobacillus luteolus]
MEAVVYIGHGSRNATANNEFVQFIKEVMTEVGTPIQAYGFLELEKPTIKEAVEECILKGATNIKVIPVLLLSGIHVTVDIPNEIKALEQEYPYLSFLYGRPLGADDLMVDILLRRINEKSSSESRGILLVGHGSREPEAGVEFEEIRRKVESESKSPIFTSYLKAQEPAFSVELERRVKGDYQQLVVLPFLLFKGGFISKMNDEISSVNHSETEIILCEPLGFDYRLKSIVLKRVYELSFKEER